MAQVTLGRADFTLADPAPGATSGHDDAGRLALGLAGLCAFLNVYATQPLLPMLEKTFGASQAEAALTVSAPSLAVAVAAPFVGCLADRVGRRKVIVASLFALVVPTAMAASATTIAALITWRFLQGLCVPGIYAVAIAYAACRFGVGAMGKAMAVLITGNVIGGFLGRTLTGGFAASLGWRLGFVALASLTLLGALMTQRWLPEEPPSTPTTKVPNAAPIVQWLNAPVAATLWVGFSVLFVQVALFTYVTFHLSAPPFELGPGALSGVFAVYLIGALVTPVSGRFIDRYGARRAMLATLSLSVLGALLTLTPSLGAVLAGLAVCASCTFIGQSAATSHLARVVNEAGRTQASGFYLCCYYVGGAVGGVAPALAWHHGDWTACIVLVLATQVVTSLVILRLWRDQLRRAG